MTKYLFIILLFFSTTALALVDENATIATQELDTKLRNASGNYIYYGYMLAQGEGEGTGYQNGDVWDTNGYQITGKHGYLMQVSMENMVDTNFDPLADADYCKRKYIMPHLRNGGILMMLNLLNNYGSWTVAEIMPGGARRAQYLTKLQKSADFIKSLLDHNGNLYPVILRQFHENDGTWFFWGQDSITPTEYQALFQDFVVQMRDTNGVHNALYCYSPEFLTVAGETFESRYPGDDYVDIISIDNYPRTSDYTNATSQDRIGQLYDAGILHNKPFGISEGAREIGNNEMADYWTTGYSEALLNGTKSKYVSFAFTWTSPIYSPLVGRSDEASFLTMSQNPKIKFLQYYNNHIYNATLRNCTLN